MAGPGSFRFLHAADLHIDSPLRGLARYEGAPVDRIRAATRGAVGNLVALAKAERVDFLVVAGDVFDGDWKDVNTGLWFQARLQELVEAGIGVFLLRGNHDAASTMSKGLSLPKGVRRFRDSEPQTIRIKELGLALHGQSFPEREVTDNLAAVYPEPVAGAFNIGVLHTSLAGYEGHDSYAPCSVADLVAKGYDYWALGHVHGREVVQDGDPWIVFPGNTQGRHARELGPKGATLVEVEEGQVASVEHRVLDVVRWGSLDVDLGPVETADAAIALVRTQLEAAAREAGERLLAARVTLSGESAVADALRRDEERLAAEVRAVGLELGDDVWVEKVRLRAYAPAVLDPRAEAGLAALASRVRSAELGEDELLARQEELSAVLQRLPAEVRARLDADALVAASLPSARALLAAHLSGASRAGFDRETSRGGGAEA